MLSEAKHLLLPYVFLGKADSSPARGIGMTVLKSSMNDRALSSAVDLKPQFESPQVARTGCDLPFDLPGCCPSDYVAASDRLPR
jgi:hypothetical protein